MDKFESHLKISQIAIPYQFKPRCRMAQRLTVYFWMCWSFEWFIRTTESLIFLELVPWQDITHRRLPKHLSSKIFYLRSILVNDLISTDYLKPFVKETSSSEFKAGVGAATDSSQLLDSRVQSSLVVAYSRVRHTRLYGVL